MNDTDTITGFAYPLDNNVWVVSTEPHLKSCCVGKKDVGHQWWIIEPDSPLPQNRAITLKGTIVENEGRLFLKNAFLDHPQPANWEAIVALFICVLIAICWIGRPRKTEADKRN